MTSKGGQDIFMTIRVAKKDMVINLKAATKNPCARGMVHERWYWGNITRKLVEDGMQKAADGSFVVRDASSAGDFALTLRVRGECRHIRIICHEGRCGFNIESLEYKTVLELLDAHRETKLTEYNPDLNVLIATPFGRIVSLGSRMPKIPIDDSYKRIHIALRCHLEGLQADFDRLSRLFDHLYWRKISIDNTLDDNERKLINLKKLYRSINRSHNVMTKNRPRVAAWVREHFAKSINRNNASLKAFREYFPHIITDSLILEDFEVLLIEQLQQLEPEIVYTYEVLDDWKQIVMDHSDKPQDVLRLCQTVSTLTSYEPVGLSQILLEIPLKWDPTSWFSVDSNKDHSTARILAIVDHLIHTKEENINGVFLIRPSASHSGFFVLSVNMGRRVHHCRIEFSDQPLGEREVGFAFADTLTFFPTLVDFVRFYSVHSLGLHNSILDTTLNHPAFPGYSALTYV